VLDVCPTASFISLYAFCSFLFSLYQYKEKEKRTKEKRKTEEADALANDYLLLQAVEATKCNMKQGGF